MLSGPLLTLLIAPMLIWMSLLTLPDLGESDRHGKLNEKSMMCLTCLITPGVDSVSWEEDWRDVT